MTIRLSNMLRRGHRTILAAASLCSVVALGACGHLMTALHGGPARPAESEFGLGPRASVAGLYTVTLQPVAPLAKNRMQKMRVHVLAGDRPVDGATIDVDGGMPQHGHGLPTRPRVTRALGEGVYEIDGVRFNMGGWWELHLAIAAHAGSDAVTFNLDL